MESWIDGWMDRQVFGMMSRYKNIDEWDVQADGWRVNGWMEGQIGEWMRGRLDR